jgi:hypothetical protein
MSGVILFFAVIVLIGNFSRIAGNMKLDGPGMFVHLMAGFVTAGSFLALAGGFIWFLVDKYAK